jgi:hypothetical protein
MLYAVERQREQRRQKSERGELRAEEILRQQRKRQQERIEQCQKRQTGDGLDHAGDAQQQMAQARRTGRGKPERHADEEPNRLRADAEKHMLAEIIRQALQRFGDARVELLHHGAPPASRSWRTRSA